MAKGAKAKSKTVSRDQAVLSLFTNALFTSFFMTPPTPDDALLVSKGSSLRTLRLVGVFTAIGIFVILSIAIYVLGSVALDTANMWVYTSTILLIVFAVRSLIVAVTRWRTLV